MTTKASLLLFVVDENMSVTAAALGILAATAVLLVFIMGNGQMSTRTASQPPPSPQQNASEINGSLVQFVLFRRYSQPSNLMVGDIEGFNRSGFDFNNPTKIIIHGFLSSIKQEVFVLTKNAYLTEGDYNVIGMDWSVLCEFEYFSAMRGAQLAATALNSFLNHIIAIGVDPEQIHLIGHSLGAHVAGMGADTVAGGKIARITGLDPAAPGYGDVSHNLRLDPGDAKLVDVIHTYMRILSLAEPVGHVDFYPNGGRFQPGCPDFFDIWKVPESISCNHGRSYMYFIESIPNKGAFKSQRCMSVEEAVYGRCFEESDVYMGQAGTYQNGLYYVRTNAQSPFSLSH